MKAKLLVKNLHNTKKNLEDHKDIKKLVPLLKANSEERQLQDGIKHPGMKTISMVIVTHVMILVTRHGIADTMQEVLGILTIQLDVGLPTM